MDQPRSIRGCLLHGGQRHRPACVVVPPSIALSETFSSVHHFPSSDDEDDGRDAHEVEQHHQREEVLADADHTDTSVSVRLTCVGG